MNSRLRKLRVLLLAATLLCPNATLASPFCVTVRGIAPQCDYVDVKECQRRAAQLGGDCETNPKEMTPTYGSGKFCVMDSSRVSRCIYSDRDDCTADAARSGAVCIENITPLTIKDSPYRLDPNRNY